MSLSINNVRGVLSSVSFDNETVSKKAAVDTFEMVRGGSYLKSHKSASAKDAKCSSSSCKEEAAATQTQDQTQNSKAAADSKVEDAKEEAATQTQDQAQVKEDAAQAQAQGK